MMWSTDKGTKRTHELDDAHLLRLYAFFCDRVEVLDEELRRRGMLTKSRLDMLPKGPRKRKRQMSGVVERFEGLDVSDSPKK